MKREEVIVIGGGASGLMAARLLCSQYQVTIIESKPQLGGRILSVDIGNGITIEGGAEFVHGQLPLTMQLLQEAKLAYESADGKMLRKVDGRWSEQDEMVEHWDRLMTLMNSQRDDVTLQEFLNHHFGEERYDSFRRHISQFAQGFDVADPERVSVQSLYREWSAEEENFRIEGGYGRLVRFLEDECRKGGCIILPNTSINAIDWARGTVKAISDNGTMYTAGKALITIPISHYPAGRIRFSPAIDNYVNASLDIGYGSVIKIIVQVKKPFWPAGISFFLSEELVPTWWTQMPFDNTLLTGWVGGPMADKLSASSDEEIIEKAIVSLSNLFGVAQDALRENFVSTHVFNWSRHTDRLGAYSYSTPKSTAARQVLNTPLEQTLYFAGEALHGGPNGGTVEAALASGKEVAEKMLTL